MPPRLSPERLLAAEEGLTTVLSLTEPADNALHRLFRSSPNLGLQDRAFIAETTYTALRYLRRLEIACQDKVTPRRILLATLMYYEGYSVRELSSHLHPKESAWLENIRGIAFPTDPALSLNLPDWLYAKLAEKFSNHDLIELAHALNSPAPLDLRTNTLIKHRDDVMLAFQDKNIPVTQTPYSPLGLRLRDKMALMNLDLFKEGAIEVQDEGSQLICQLMEVRRRERIADFCAGAGGKSLAMAASMQSRGQIYAFDVSEKRLAKMGPRLKRSNASNIQPVRITSESDSKLERYHERMDRVLVDAPCSGLGTLRRNPELKWRQTPDTVTKLVKLQESILNAAARLVKPGGRLVYATCSLLDEENINQIDRFLACHPDFKLLPANEILQRQRINLDTGILLELWPHKHGTDAFFAAAMEKIRSE
ncbi:MAG TPA: RsmB/NOP family class I SAM-dependent RNA methyltransferase [Burkholderiales bacterium]|nr:RsmB/NOP family class I SAM-dependent RNA methyltransferase [Burkholderiales bacterium]